MHDTRVQLTVGVYVCVRVCVCALSPCAQLVLDEAKLLSQLEHQNIICYIGAYESNGVMMIEMEYADGGDLYVTFGPHRLTNFSVLWHKVVSVPRRGVFFHTHTATDCE